MRVEGLGFRVEGLGFRVEGLEPKSNPEIKTVPFVVLKGLRRGPEPSQKGKWWPTPGPRTLNPKP